MGRGRRYVCTDTGHNTPNHGSGFDLATARSLPLGLARMASSMALLQERAPLPPAAPGPGDEAGDDLGNGGGMLLRRDGEGRGGARRAGGGGCEGGGIDVWGG